MNRVVSWVGAWLGLPRWVRLAVSAVAFVGGLVAMLLATRPALFAVGTVAASIGFAVVCAEAATAYVYRAIDDDTRPEPEFDADDEWRLVPYGDRQVHWCCQDDRATACTRCQNVMAEVGAS